MYMIMISNYTVRQTDSKRTTHIVCKLYAVMDQIIGVSHKYYRKVHSNNAKKHWFVYFYYKTRIKKGVTMYCLKCSNSFLVYEKNAVCPYCE